MNETTIVYNSQKSGYLAKCWSLTQAQASSSSSSSSSESGSSDEDVASETGHEAEAECAESSHEIESKMELSADEENLPRRRRNRRAAAHGAEIQLGGGKMVTILYLKYSVFLTLRTQPMRDGINPNVTCLWMKAWLSSRVDLLLDSIYQPNPQDGE